MGIGLKPSRKVAEPLKQGGAKSKFRLTRVIVNMNLTNAPIKRRIDFVAAHWLTANRHQITGLMVNNPYGFPPRWFSKSFCHPLMVGDIFKAAHLYPCTVTTHTAMACAAHFNGLQGITPAPANLLGQASLPHAVRQAIHDAPPCQGQPFTLHLEALETVVKRLYGVWVSHGRHDHFKTFLRHGLIEAIRMEQRLLGFPVPVALALQGIPMKTRQPLLQLHKVWDEDHFRSTKQMGVTAQQLYARLTISGRDPNAHAAALLLWWASLLLNGSTGLADMSKAFAPSAYTRRLLTT